MKYIKLYENQTTALGQVISTPNVVVLKTSDKVLYIPDQSSDVTLIKDDDFISYSK